MSVKRFSFIIMLFVLVLISFACTSPAQPSTVEPEPEAPAAAEPQTTPEPKPTPTPEPPAKKTATTIQTGSGVVVKSAADWASDYADIYASYLKNSENSAQVDHVQEYPVIAALYEGMAFSKYYNSARGHTYTVEDLTATGRPHALANCFSCKTPDFTAKVIEMGDEAYQIPFEDMLASVNNPVSCFNCHADTPGEIVITHTYLSDAMGGELDNVAAANLSCAQCHVEYYFDPVTKAVVLPYSGLDDMNPDDMLDYFNNLMVDGVPFADYVNPRSGVRQIKLQHPEFETFMGEGSVHASTFTCADCHMGTSTGSDGSTYKSHNWVSPLASEEISATCASCHADLEGLVRPIQEGVMLKLDSVADLLYDITEELALAAEGSAYTDDELDNIRLLARNAQFYWDFVFVENSDGAHNSKLAHLCLDKAEALANEALALIK